jgi:hypothetical protein
MYRVWQAMITRCCNQNQPGYKNYGGRGIRVCDRWRNSFEAFIEDMGERPGPGYSLDRIDNDGNYEPGNCRWATRTEQRRNCRHLIKVMFEGREYLLFDLAKEHGLKPLTVRARLEAGWTLEEAVLTPAQNWGRGEAIKKSA